MSDLNAKALVAATYADCNDNPFGEPCLCQRDGWVSGECADQHEQLGNCVRTYLRESGIGAVVEAAQEWALFLATFCRDRNINLVLPMESKEARLLSAVTALEKDAGHE